MAYVKKNRSNQNSCSENQLKELVQNLKQRSGQNHLIVQYYEETQRIKTEVSRLQKVIDKRDRELSLRKLEIDSLIKRVNYLKNRTLHEVLNDFNNKFQQTQKLKMGYISEESDETYMYFISLDNESYLIDNNEYYRNMLGCPVVARIVNGDHCFIVRTLDSEEVMFLR
jgi:Fe2+ transport system protein B